MSLTLTSDRAESITRFTVEVLTCWTVILSVSVAGRGALPEPNTHTPLPLPASTTVPCCHFHVWQSMASSYLTAPWYAFGRGVFSLVVLSRFFSPTSHTLASFPFLSPSPRAALLVEVQHALPSSCSRRPDGPCVGSYFKSHPIVIRDAPGRSFVSLCKGLQSGVAGASAGSGCSSQVVRLLLWEEGPTSRPRPRSCRASGRRRCGHALAR